MAQLTLTVDDAIVPRLREAYGVTTNGQLKTAIINQIRQTVKGHEVTTAQATAKTTLEQAEATYRSSLASAETKAESEIVLS